MVRWGMALPEGGEPQNTPYPKNFKPHFFENLSITFDQILHACRGACPLSVKEVSQKKLGWKFCTIPKCEISVRGAWPPNGGQMSRFLHYRFWVPSTETGWRRNFKNIFTQQCTNREKRKNVNVSEIETGSGRGQVTSSSGRSPCGPCRV